MRIFTITVDIIYILVFLHVLNKLRKCLGERGPLCVRLSPQLKLALEFSHAF